MRQLSSSPTGIRPLAQGNGVLCFWGAVDKWAGRHLRGNETKMQVDKTDEIPHDKTLLEGLEQTKGRYLPGSSREGGRSCI
jgi:hypothetical protein